MSDQPDAEPARTFWFRCAWGHVEERALPLPERRMTCAAKVPAAEAAQDRPLASTCGAELHLYGPTVGEWRATNTKMVEAEAEHARRVAHLERLLASSDSALGECASQLDRALANEGDLGAQLARAQRRIGDLEGDVGVHLHAASRMRDERDEALTETQTTRAREAEAEVVRLRAIIEQLVEERDNATRAAMLNQEAAQQAAFNERGWESALKERDSARHERDLALARLAGTEEAAAQLTQERDAALRDQEAMRANAAAATRERDTSRRAHEKAEGRLTTLRRFLVGEAQYADETGHPKRADRLREARIASFATQAEPHFDARTASFKPVIAGHTLDSQEPITYVPPIADPGSLDEPDWRTFGTIVADGSQVLDADDVVITRSGERLGVVFLGSPSAEWRSAVAELRAALSITDGDTGPEMIRRALSELRRLRSDARKGAHRRTHGFTVVRDVNHQTEQARDRAMADALEQRNARRTAEAEVKRLTALFYEHGLDPSDNPDFDGLDEEGRCVPPAPRELPIAAGRVVQLRDSGAGHWTSPTVRIAEVFVGRDVDGRAVSAALRIDPEWTP